MAALSAFYPQITVYAPAAPVNVIDFCLRSACIEFADRSLILQQLNDPVGVTAGTADYELDLPAQTQVARVLDVWLAGDKLTPTAPPHFNDADALYGSPDAENRGTPRYAFFKTPAVGVLTLAPAPGFTQPNSLRVRLAYKPSRNATAVDDTLFNDWADEIVAGALARVYAIPGQPFTNFAAVDGQRALFLMGVGRAKLQAETGKIMTGSRMVGPTIYWGRE